MLSLGPGFSSMSPPSKRARSATEVFCCGRPGDFMDLVWIDRMVADGFRKSIDTGVLEGCVVDGCVMLVKVHRIKM